MASRFWTDLKRFFLRGLAAALPALLTATILLWVFRFMRDTMGKPIEKVLQWVIVQVVCLGQGIQTGLRGNGEVWTAVKNAWQGWYLQWVGFLLAFIGIYIFC